MELDGVADPWLLDDYRRFCTREKSVPKPWLEKDLLRIPYRPRSLGLKLTPPTNASSLSESEMCYVIQTLLQNKERKLTTRAKPFLPHAPTSRQAAKKEHRPLGFVIPGMDASSAALGKDMTESFSVPLTSLQLGGEGMSLLVLKELTFWCMTLSSSCMLRDLIITSATIDDSEDPLLCLSLCAPLRRSLTRLVMRDCRLLGQQCTFAWSLFFGTTPLEHLTLDRTGLDVQGIRFLCRILCDNDIPRLHLRILRLRIGGESPSIEYYNELAFVDVQRCLSTLTKLEYFEVDGLTLEQQSSLSQEWRSIKGEVSSHIQLEGDCLRLSLTNRDVPEMELNASVFFETMPKTSFLQMPTNQQHHMQQGPRLTMPQELHRAPIHRMPASQRPLPRRTQQQRIVQSSQLTQGTTEQGTGRMETTGSSVSIAEQLWRRYKPPLCSLRRSSKHSGPLSRPKINQKRRRRKRSLYSSHLFRSRTKPLECYFSAHGEPQTVDDVTSESISDDSDDFDDDGVEGVGPRSHRPKFKRIYSPIGGRSHLETDIREGAVLPSRSGGGCLIDEALDRSEESDIATEDEKQYGPPPGGRKVEIGNGNAAEDLMGYMSDGFIRPDDELVYTTSASDEEIENDLHVLSRAGRRMIELSFSSNSSIELNDCTAERDKHINTNDTCDLTEEERAVDSHSRATQSKSHNLSALEKELQELRPFYYDKNREKYRPGGFFTCTEAEASGEGVTLRNGRHIAVNEHTLASPPDQGSLRDKHKERQTHSPPAIHKARCDIESDQADIQTERISVDDTVDIFSNRTLEDQPDDLIAARPCNAVIDGVEAMEHETAVAVNHGRTEIDMEDQHNLPLHRLEGSREARRLQPWAWDQYVHPYHQLHSDAIDCSNFEKFPPKQSMYCARNGQRRRTASERYQPNID